MTFQDKIDKMAAALRVERNTLNEHGRSSAVNAIDDYLANAPASSLARLFDILTAGKEG